MTHQVLVTWLAKKSHTNLNKVSSKLSYFLTNLEFFWLESGFTMSQVWSSHFRRSKWPLNGLFWWNMVRWFSQGCLIHSLKSWDFSFLFFSSSRPVNTFNCQKCTFWVRTESTSKLFSENYFHFLGSEYLNLVANFEYFWIFLSFCPTSSSNFEMLNCQKLNFQDQNTWI